MKYFLLVVLFLNLNLYTVQSFKTFNYIPAVTKGLYYRTDIADVSDEYPIQATPTKETFKKAWSNIYRRLFLFNFAWPWNSDEYKENMKLQRKWIDEWREADFFAANQTLYELLVSTQKLRQDYIEDKDDEDLGNAADFYCDAGGTYTLKTIDMYLTWLYIAGNLNFNIYDVYVENNTDKSLNSMDELMLSLKEKRRVCDGVDSIIKLYEEGLLLKNRNANIKKAFEFNESWHESGRR